MKTVKIATVSGGKKDCIAYALSEGLAITKAAIMEKGGELVYTNRYRITHVESGYCMFEVGKLKYAKAMLKMLLETGFDFTQTKEVVSSTEYRPTFLKIHQDAKANGWYL